WWPSPDRQGGHQQEPRQWEKMSESWCADKWLPKRSNHAADKRCRPASADLLSEDRTHSDLKRIPTAGDAQPRCGLCESPQRGLASQILHDVGPVCVQVEHRSDSLSDEKQRTWVGNLNPNQKRVLGSVKRDLEITRGFLYRNGTSINAIDDDFDPGSSLFGQKRQQALPIVGRAVWKP